MGDNLDRQRDYNLAEGFLLTVQTTSEGVIVDLFSPDEEHVGTLAWTAAELADLIQTVEGE